jgi:predicted NBD/HSP70 family sugar kinase
MRRVEVGQRSETVRRANLSSIVRELHGQGPQTRSELVAHTGLTRSAIRGLTGELAAAHFVSETPPARLGTPGRPSPLVRLSAGRATVLALDIAVDSLAAAVVGLGGEVHELERIDRARGESSAEVVVTDLAALAARVLDRTGRRASLVGVGVAVAGVVRRLDGLVAMAPNLGWTDVPLGRQLAVALALPVPIWVANEADLGALAEFRRGAATGSDTVLFVSGEVGVGGGLIANGRPLSGVAGYGGEIGHMTVNPDGSPCGCGSVGCWETEIGEDALLRRAGHSTAGGRAEVDRVLEEAAAGLPATLAALDGVGRWLGIGLAGLVNVLNPSLVVMGGLFGRIHPYVAATVDAELDRRALPPSRRLVRVVPATLGIDAPVLGAAELAFEPLLADPSAWLGMRHALPQLASA